jgi:hypothetical protein
LELVYVPLHCSFIWSKMSALIMVILLLSAVPLLTNRVNTEVADEQCSSNPSFNHANSRGVSFAGDWRFPRQGFVRNIGQLDSYDISYYTISSCGGIGFEKSRVRLFLGAQIESESLYQIHCHIQMFPTGGQPR